MTTNPMLMKMMMNSENESDNMWILVLLGLVAFIVGYFILAYVVNWPPFSSSETPPPGATPVPGAPPPSSPSSEHATMDSCLKKLRDEAKKKVDDAYDRSKTNATCHVWKDISYHWWMVRDASCPIKGEDDLRIDLKLQYKKCPDDDIYEYQYDMGLYVDNVLQRSGGSYEYPPHHTPFKNVAYNMIDTFFQPDVGPFSS